MKGIHKTETKPVTELVQEGGDHDGGHQHVSVLRRQHLGVSTGLSQHCAAVITASLSLLLDKMS
ncbi:hypothetical protein E2C01_094720 [Portunus trituberculatus]|uniref:Uncharacterized protein n=1 Tax=Portunus trituberculatus TaxID=210409 RepID=A0A5B7JXM7_PORTR|nr:hypothetical protein [Portunus trituberculatus]